MTVNEQVEEFKTYKNLSKQLRKTIKKEINIGKYPHLINPNNKNGIKTIENIDQLLGLKCRFSIMPRKEFVQGNGNSTKVGHNEIILAIYGNFSNEEKLDEGFVPELNYKARFILGENFRDDAIRILVNKVSKYSNLLEQGNYNAFVKNTMKVVNNAVDTYKNLKVSEEMSN